MDNPSMRHMAQPGRREVLGRLMGLALAGGVWTHASAADALKAMGVAGPDQPALAAPALATLAAAADLIVPRTQTPGALDAGVPAFIGVLYQQWMNADERALLANGLDALDTQAQALYRQPFAACGSGQRTALLRALRESQPYKGRAGSVVQRLTDPATPFFTRLRDLVMFGYFTSEAGTTQALRYIPVPGQYLGDVPMARWPYQMIL